MNITEVMSRNVTLGDGKPKICIPVTAVTRQELVEQCTQIGRAPFDIVEWRADYYEDTADEGWLPKALEILRGMLGERALLFTFRTKEEGGVRSISPEEYAHLNEKAAASGLVDFVDLELNRGEDLLSSLTEKIHSCGVKVIGSYHDFAGTPDCHTIVTILCRMQKLGVDVTKAALMPEKEEDVLEVLAASLAMKKQYADRPFITMSMGPYGAVSRLCGALTGSAVTFATAGRSSAPGQMDAAFVAEALSALQPGA